MPANAAAQMKNNVMARSRTASAERLKLRIGRFLLLPFVGQVNDLTLVQEMRSECHYSLSGLHSAGHDSFLSPHSGNSPGPKLHFRLLVLHPDARSVAAILGRSGG